MLDVKLLRSNPDAVRQAVKNRGGRYIPALEELVKINEEWRSLNAEVEPLRARRNQAAEEIGRLKRDKKDASALIKEMEDIKSRVKGLEENLKAVEARLEEGLLGVPNIPHETVPVGKDASENRVIRQWGEPRKFSFTPKDHQEVGEKLGILDMARAAKLSGARFALLAGAGAKLERALINFMLNLHTEKHGYHEIFPPFLVTRQTMTGTGQLPKFEEELYACKDDDLFLIPTAEVPLTNMFRDEFFDEDKLPAVCAYTACFRREAGTYGKDARGLIRNHQFNKIELVRFAKPEDTLKELDILTGHAEEVLKQLGLPYRVLELCTGDVGFSSAKTFDLEVWMPSEKDASGKIAGAWREISSCSTFTDFQARRIGLRMKRKDGSRNLVHTLNGSGVAVGRTLAAILENYQREDGTVLLPEILRPFMAAEKISSDKQTV